MAIITVSRGTFSGGKEFAECLAEKSGYKCISREVLVEAARERGVPLDKLTHALEDAGMSVGDSGCAELQPSSFMDNALVLKETDKEVTHAGIYFTIFWKRQ